MSQDSLTLGQAIDQISTALSKLDPDARSVALTAVCSMLGIDFGQKSAGAKAAPQSARTVQANRDEGGTSAAPEPGMRTIKDIRTLKEEKRPKSAQQMACLVAYYLMELAPENERSDTVSTSDLDKYFKQAGFKLPEDIKQVLKNAKRAGYFDSSERGKYSLNAVGYNLVTHTLPDSSE